MKKHLAIAAGLAVLNTMPGECSQIINQNQCGLDYKAGDINSCIQAIKEIVSNLDRLHTMQQNSRRLAEEVYDRKVLYQQYAELIEEVDDLYRNRVFFIITNEGEEFLKKFEELMQLIS